MLEKHIPAERLKPTYPCPNCNKQFDDCICTEETVDEGFVQMMSGSLMFWLSIPLFLILMIVLKWLGVY